MGAQDTNEGLTRYLNTLEAWALSIGCAVGWGAFVMPGTTFLPLAGPLGTAIGMIIGAAIMFLIGCNYHYLMNRYPDAGGTLTYSIRAFGFDHGILSAWFLMLVYIAIMWANATAVVLIVRNLLGDALQWGFHYQLAGYHVYGGEVALTIALIVLSGIICIKSKRTAAVIQTVMAILLVTGVAVCVSAVIIHHGGISHVTPAFSPDVKSRADQIFNIIVLAPWAFVGFESISNSTQAFRFSPQRSIWIMLVSLILGMMCYVMLGVIATADVPAGFANWTEYINKLDSQSGYASIPTFYAVTEAMKRYGPVVLGITLTGGIVTGLIGNYIAASRLMYAMTKDGILPEWFGRLDKKANPSNALLFLMLISLPVPFVGRAAIGWIVDVNTIGALIAYAYTSFAAFRLAEGDHRTYVKITGIIGTVASVIFLIYFMVPNIWTVNSLPTESYLILIVWSVLGFLFFRYVFGKDTHDRFGKSTAIWVALLFLIFFTSMLWFRQMVNNTTARVLRDLKYYNETELAEHGVVLDEEDTAESELYLQQKMEEVNSDMVRSSWMQMAVIIASLFIMFSIYRAMTQREKKQIERRIQAEESSRAKSTFLSNVSHDIRTPMNAIIGYTGLAKKVENVPEEASQYLDRIEMSGHQLLSLISDVLDMSSIESGKLEFAPQRTDLVKMMDDVREVFSTQMITKSINYTVDTSKVKDRTVICDPIQLNRVLLNLISNAYKYTPDGGAVRVSLVQTGLMDGTGSYRLSVKDTGIGMSPEFASMVFESYSRDKAVHNIQGTGLGMAITKSIVDLLGGNIEVHTEEGKGTEFAVSLKLPVAEDGPDTEAEEEGSLTVGKSLSGVKLLLTDDNEINREIAALILKEAGFDVDTAENGKEAVAKVASSRPGEYRAVLMDIQMPVMNGYEATRAIRRLENTELSKIPVIAMTANVFTEDIKAAKEAGMDDHIPKPIDATLLIKTLGSFIEDGGRTTL